MTRWEQIKRIKDEHEGDLLERAGVIGCAIGYKQAGGMRTGELCLICYVKKKLPEEKLEKQDIIPGEIGGILTDVVETGEFHAF